MKIVTILDRVFVGRFSVRHFTTKVGNDDLAAAMALPYSAKFSRDKIFADWPFTKFCGNNFRGLRILVSHAQSDAAAAARSSADRRTFVVVVTR